MVKLLLILLTSGFTTGVPQSEIPQRVDWALDAHMPVGAWPKLIAESPAEERMLWEAQSVLFHFGAVTGTPNRSGIIWNRIIRGWSVGWYTLRPQSPSVEELRLDATNQTWGLTPVWAQSNVSDRPVVVVLDARDYRSHEGLHAEAEHKIEELRREGARHIIVMRREDRPNPESPPPAGSPINELGMIYWITRGELQVVIKRDFADDAEIKVEKYSLLLSPPFPNALNSTWDESLYYVPSP